TFCLSARTQKLHPTAFRRAAPGIAGDGKGNGADHEALAGHIFPALNLTPTGGSMKLGAVVLYLCLVLAATALTEFHGPNTHGDASSKSAATRQATGLRVVQDYGKLPLSFEAN